MKPAFKPLPPDKIYFTIGEVSNILNVNTSLIRYWEKEFPQVNPHKNRNGERAFTVKDIDILKRIYILVKYDGYTLEGAKKILDEPAKNHEQENILNTLNKIKIRLLDIRKKIEK